MTDLEKVEEIWRHIHHVQDNCKLLGSRLIHAGEVELGLRLISNSLIHDQSKFSGIEWDHLHKENDDKESLTLAIKQHNRTNPHHPEYWAGGIHSMPRVFVAEMVADWKARSSEFGDSLKEWVNGEAAKRYEFSEKDQVCKEVMYFCEMLCDSFNKQVDLNALPETQKKRPKKRPKASAS